MYFSFGLYFFACISMGLASPAIGLKACAAVAGIKKYQSMIK